MRILIDIDSTIAHTLHHWVWYINHLLLKDKARKLRVEDVKEWDISKAGPLVEAEIDPKKVFKLLDDYDFMREIPSIAGAAEVIAKLRERGHEVYLVTARFSKGAMDITKDWVERKIPGMDPKSEIIYCADKTMIPADVLVDDKPTTLIDYATAYPNALVIGLRMPYNEHVPVAIPRVQIVGDGVSTGYYHGALEWGEILGIISNHKK